MDDIETPHVTRLTDAECWARLHRSGRGVLATAADGQPDLFPVNYLVDAGALMIRTAPGAKVDQIGASPRVAFEIDGNDGHDYWSVVMRGTAEILTDQVEIIGSGALELYSWAPGEKHVFVRVTPVSVEGRRVPRIDFTRGRMWG